MGFYDSLSSIKFLKIKVHKTATRKGVFIASSNHHPNLMNIVNENKDVNFHIFTDSIKKYTQDNVTIIECTFSSPAFRDSIAKHLILFDFAKRDVPLIVFDPKIGFSRSHVDYLLRSPLDFFSSCDFCSKRNYTCGYTDLVMNPYYIAKKQLPRSAFLDFCNRITSRMERYEENVLMDCYIVPNVMPMGVVFDFSSFNKLSFQSWRFNTEIEFTAGKQFEHNPSVIASLLTVVKSLKDFANCEEILRKHQNDRYFEYRHRGARSEDVYIFLIGSNKKAEKFFHDSQIAYEVVAGSSAFSGKMYNDRYKKIKKHKYLIFYDGKINHPEYVKDMYIDALPAQLVPVDSYENALPLGSGVSAISSGQFEEINGFANYVPYPETLYERSLSVFGIVYQNIQPGAKSRARKKPDFKKEMLLSYSRHFMEDGLRRNVPVELPEPNILIVLPFGNLEGPERPAQLKEYLKQMKGMLKKNTTIVIAEQINHKVMNAGWCKNVGVAWYLKYAVPDIVIFNDIDMIPDIRLFIQFWFVNSPISLIPADDGVYVEKIPVGGGLSGMRLKDFRAANGFPNTFWGWGGEDNSIDFRLRRIGKKIQKNREGRICHTDQLQISQKKKQFLESNGKIVPNLAKVLENDKKTWKNNGFAQTKYTISQEPRIGQINHIKFY